MSEQGAHIGAPLQKDSICVLEVTLKMGHWLSNPFPLPAGTTARAIPEKRLRQAPPGGQPPFAAHAVALKEGQREHHCRGNEDVHSEEGTDAVGEQRLEEEPGIRSVLGDLGNEMPVGKDCPGHAEEEIDGFAVHKRSVASATRAKQSVERNGFG